MSGTGQQAAAASLPFHTRKHTLRIKQKEQVHGSDFMFGFKVITENPGMLSAAVSKVRLHLKENLSAFVAVYCEVKRSTSFSTL